MIRACTTYGTDEPTPTMPFGNIARTWWSCDSCGAEGDGDKPAACPACAVPADEVPA